jgi:two-component sensor histidine kinase
MALQQKDVLFREVEHRVKNNLQIISSLLSVEAARFSDGRAHVFQKSRDRVASMALVYEKLCHSTDVTEIDFKDYVDSLTSSFWNSYWSELAGIDLHTDIDVKLSIDEAVPCGLILQEFLSNSIKYAFNAGTGQIWIDFHERADTFELVYRDSGPGLPAGVDPRNPKSLGLQLVNDLSYQLGGQLFYQYANGTMLSLTFPRTFNRG